MAEASYPPELLYHLSTTGRGFEGEVATFGITWHAQDALGEIVFVETPAVGTQLSANEAYTEVESVKAVSDVFAPLTGEVIETNAQLAAKPELINEDPYGEAGWSRSGSPTRARQGACSIATRTSRRSTNDPLHSRY